LLATECLAECCAVESDVERLLAVHMASGRF